MNTHIIFAHQAVYGKWGRNPTESEMNAHFLPVRTFKQMVIAKKKGDTCPNLHGKNGQAILPAKGE